MMTKRGSWIALLAVVGSVITAVPPPAAGQDISKEASTFVQSLDAKAVALSTGQNLEAGDREQRFHDLFVANFDVPAIGRFVLGRYWRAATAVQQTEFLSLFETSIVKTYSSRFAAYTGERFTVTGARADGDSATVSSAIAQPDGSPLRVDWRVTKVDGRLRIIDVMVGGVSMSVTQQQELGSVIQRSGGQIDGLLTTMRERAQQPARAVRN